MQQHFASACAMPLAASVASEHQRVAAARFVDEVDRNREVTKDLAQPSDVVAHLLGKERGVGPRLAENLRGRKVTMRVIDEKAQELVLPLGQRDLAAAM